MSFCPLANGDGIFGVPGTFLLVVVAAGAHVVAAQSNGKVTLDMIVVAPGLMVMAIIYFMGTVSGAHLNRRDISLRSQTQFSVAASAWLCCCAVGRRCFGGVIFAPDVR